MLVSQGYVQASEAYGAVVMLKGTKFGALPCVTKPKPVRAEGFPTLEEFHY